MPEMRRDLHTREAASLILLHASLQNFGCRFFPDAAQCLGEKSLPRMRSLAYAAALPYVSIAPQETDCEDHEARTEGGPR